MPTTHENQVNVIERLRAATPNIYGNSQEFAQSLVDQFTAKGFLSEKQWYWVGKLCERAQTAPRDLTGDYKAISVMFQIAGEHLKKPRVNLVTDEGVKIRFTFDAVKNEIYINNTGRAWQESYCGKVVEQSRLIDYRSRLTADIIKTVNEFSAAPHKVALAHAKKLGRCCFCSTTLSTATSKRLGYGPTCADHYGLPWKVSADDKAKNAVPSNVGEFEKAMS